MISALINFKSLVLLVAFFVATPLTFARPGNHEVREAVREAQHYQKNGRDSDRSGRFDGPQSTDHSSRSDSSKRAGRMSPEEKRALRQQINEAGQDLYYRKH